MNLEMAYTALFGCEYRKILTWTYFRMQDKTIAYVGDSLGRQMFQSMMCMVTGGKQRPDVEDVGAEYGFVLAPGAKRPDGWAYRFPSTNTTIYTIGHQHFVIWSL